jgi:hypothetical protein
MFIDFTKRADGASSQSTVGTNMWTSDVTVGNECRCCSACAGREATLLEADMRMLPVADTTGSRRRHRARKRMRTTWRSIRRGLGWR